MTFHQQTRWHLKCGECNSETDIGIRPAHMTPYACKKCNKNENFVYPQHPTVHAPDPRPLLTQRRPFYRRKSFWEGVAAGLVVVVIVFAITIFTGLPIWKKIINDAVDERVKKLDATPVDNTKHLDPQNAGE